VVLQGCDGGEGSNAVSSVKFQLSDIVYLKIDPDHACMITGIIFRPGTTQYFVGRPDGSEYVHYGIELTKDKAFTEVAGRDADA
jgi:hypothetical protein